MVIGFMLEKMEPAITGLAGKTGSSLDAIDVGGAATAVMGLVLVWVPLLFLYV